MHQLLVAGSPAYFHHKSVPALSIEVSVSMLLIGLLRTFSHAGLPDEFAASSFHWGRWPLHLHLGASQWHLKPRSLVYLVHASSDP
jgi:hypothetical protein